MENKNLVLIMDLKEQLKKPEQTNAVKRRRLQTL